MRYHVYTSNLDYAELRRRMEISPEDKGVRWGYGKTVANAIKSANALTKKIRSDMHVYVIGEDGRIYARTTYISMIGPCPRILEQTTPEVV